MIKEFLQRHKRDFGHFGKFMAVSIMNFIVDYGVLYLLTAVAGMLTAPANVISYTCGVINSFLLNRYWTFKQKHSFFSKHFIKFLFVNLISLGVNTLAVWILVDMYKFNSGLFGMQNLYAKLLATVFSFTVNFSGNKLLVFPDDNADQHNQIDKKPRGEK